MGLDFFSNKIGVRLSPSAFNVLTWKCRSEQIFRKQIINSVNCPFSYQHSLVEYFIIFLRCPPFVSLLQVTNIIMRNLGELRRVYNFYSALGFQESQDNTFVMNNLQFWRFLKDCQIHHQDLSLTDIDRHLRERTRNRKLGFYFRFKLRVFLLQKTPGPAKDPSAISTIRRNEFSSWISSTTSSHSATSSTKSMSCKSRLKINCEINVSPMPVLRQKNSYRWFHNWAVWTKGLLLCVCDYYSSENWLSAYLLKF